MKIRKTIVTLLVLMMLFSSALFAAGAKEIQDGEKLIKVISVTEDNGHYDIYGMLENGTDIIYHTTDETKSAFPINSFKEGTYLAIKDSGTMTMSLPPQSTAVEIRDVTFAVKNNIYKTSFPNSVQPVEAPVIVVGEINLDDVFSAFNYSYGYLSTENNILNGITYNAAYYSKGVFDMCNYGSVTPLLTEVEMNDALQAYVAEYLDVGRTIASGEMPTTYEEINSLPAPESLEDKFSYAFGFLTTYDLLYAGYDIIGDAFVQGCLEYIYGITPLVSVDDMVNYINSYVEYVNSLYEQYYAELAAENLTLAEAFLAENAVLENVVTLPSGVQLIYLNEADSSALSPTETDTIICDYTLRLLDGTVADQGTDIEFPLSNLIPGFVDAAVNMKVGQSITCFIHPSMGYGANGTGAIPPNALLIFDITLKDIVK